MPKQPYRILFLFLFIFFLENISAQTLFKFDRLSVRDGLSHGVVHCVLNDSKGYMWFGTDDGLNRYDGYEFTVFKPKIGDNTTLGANIVKCIFEDSDGNLWVGTAGGGLNKFDRNTETFTRYLHDDNDDKT